MQGWEPEIGQPPAAQHGWDWPHNMTSTGFTLLMRKGAALYRTILCPCRHTTMRRWVTSVSVGGVWCYPAIPTVTRYAMWRVLRRPPSLDKWGEGNGGDIQQISAGGTKDFIAPGPPACNPSLPCQREDTADLPHISQYSFSPNIIVPCMFVIPSIRCTAVKLLTTSQYIYHHTWVRQWNPSWSLIYLLPDTQCRPDHKSIVFFVPVSHCIHAWEHSLNCYHCNVYIAIHACSIYISYSIVWIAPGKHWSQSKGGLEGGTSPSTIDCR